MHRLENILDKICDYLQVCKFEVTSIYNFCVKVYHFSDMDF